jgi:hypothetical protein
MVLLEHLERAELPQVRTAGGARCPEDDALYIPPAGGGYRCQRGAEADADEGHGVHACSGAELLDGGIDALEPGAHAIWVVVLARGVPRAVVVESKRVKAGCREALRQVSIRAVYAHGLIAQGVAEDDPRAPRDLGVGRVVETEELRLDRPEDEGSRAWRAQSRETLGTSR